MANYHFSRDEIEERNRNFANRQPDPRPQGAPQYPPGHPAWMEMMGLSDSKKKRGRYDEDPDSYFGDPVMDELFYWDDEED